MALNLPRVQYYLRHIESRILCDAYPAQFSGIEALSNLGQH